MQIPSTRKTIHAGYSDREVVKAPEWHSLVVWDVFFNGMTTGLFLVSALAELCLPAIFQPISWYAYPLALLFLTIDLALLVLDLGDPWRFHHMLRVFKPNSPMSLGTWCLTAYSIPLTLIVAIDLGSAIHVLPDDSQTLGRVRQGLLALGILPALGSAIYKGVLFSTSSQPGWRTARWLGGYLTNSALVLGCTQLLLLSVIAERRESVSILRPALEWMLLIHSIPLSLLALEIFPEFARRYPGVQQMGIGSIAFIFGVTVPYVLLSFWHDPISIALAACGILIGSWLVRFVIVLLPHHR